MSKEKIEADQSDNPLSPTPTSLTKDTIQSLCTKVEDRLSGHFEAQSPSCQLLCAIRYALLTPGKRIRPLITMLACQQSGANPEIALDAACAIEMVHTASLIMDDLPAMDNAKMRRGALTTHVVFGESTAMLASITLLNKAFEILTSNDGIHSETKIRCMRYLTEAIGLNGLAGGQENDVACGKYGPSNATLKDLEKRHHCKTGALFAAAAIGGEIAGANKNIVDHLFEYGCSLGFSFQMFDDVIDVTCSQEQTGKDAAQDAQKKTVVSLLGPKAAEFSAERHLNLAIEHGQKATTITPAPLAVFAKKICSNFKAMQQ